jgi:hypothetical protein
MELPNGSFRLFATNEMVGEYNITVTTTDGEAVVNTTFTIEVIDVNDRPLKPVIEIEEGRRAFDEGESILLKALADDPDIPWGDTLTYLWTSSISGDLGSSQTVQVQLEPGVHIITLEIFDSGSLTNSTNVTVEVYPQIQKLNEVMETTTLLILIAVIFFIAGLLISLLLFLLVKKKRRDIEKEEEKEEKEEEDGSENDKSDDKKEVKKDDPEGPESSDEKDEEKKIPEKGTDDDGGDKEPSEGGEKNE